MPLPVPDAEFTDGSPKLPVGPWTCYKQYADLGKDSNKVQGLDVNINLYNPQCIVDESFVTNLATFFDDWWEITQAGVPPNELQYQPPPEHVGPDSHLLVKALCQRTGASFADVCRRIAHNLGLACNIRRYVKAGEKAGKKAARRDKREGGKANKNSKNRKRRAVSGSDDGDLEGNSKQEQQLTSDEEEEEESLTDDEEEEEEEESDVEDSEAAEAEGRPSWAMLNKLMLHELRAVAEEFLKGTDRDSMPTRKHELASYLVTVGTVTLPQFEAFLSSYRDAYVPQKRKKQPDLVLQAAAEQERQQFTNATTQKSTQRQQELYNVSLTEYVQQNGKSPTAVQASRLWDSAAQRAHDESLNESLNVHRGSGSGESVIESGERRSKRHKRTRVDGVGFLDLN
jgi:hypothetical protein